MSLATRILGPPGLARLSATHALSNAGDAFFAISLAGSLFFNVSVDAARPRIIAYLLVTLAPFILLAPLIGPLIDRYGKSLGVVAAVTVLARGILCLFVAVDLRTLLLYPEVFGILVLDKAYAVTKSALVPRLVTDDTDLVGANARLSRIATLSSLPAGAIAVWIFNVFDAVPVLRIASLFYFGAAVVAFQLPLANIESLPAAKVEHDELQSGAIRMTAGVMSVLRGSVGFLVFLVAFSLKRDAAPLWAFGAVAAASIVGGLLGTVAGPELRRRLRRDEPLLTITLLLAGIAAFIAATRIKHLDDATVILVVFVMAFSANVARMCFDSIVQREAPMAARGRAFARFETIFQLMWVIGALAAVIFQPEISPGLAALATVLVLAAIAYIGSVRGAQLPG